MSSKVSVVVRTKNEEKSVGELFEMLKNQTFKDFEVIVVDNDSKDGTLEIVKKYNPDKIINIFDKEFSHPYSLNLGIKNTKGDLIVIINGHCIPKTKTWLEDGFRNFEDPKIAGIDGYYEAGKAATNWQKIIDIVYSPLRKRRIENWNMGNTNCIIRRKLWEEYPFDESLKQGCEDYDWSKEMIARGYKTIKDPNFNVFHLHSLTLVQFLKRHAEWRKICKMIDRRKRK